MGFTKIWVHMVCATKKREPLLTKEIRQEVFAHMKKNALDKNIYCDSVNGYIEHAHALLSLKSSQTISNVTQLIKGESSYWINKNNLTSHKFEWQDDYFAVSVSESEVDRVREYIANQEIHHQKTTYQEEYDEFMLKYGFILIANSIQ